MSGFNTKIDFLVGQAIIGSGSAPFKIYGQDASTDNQGGNNLGSIGEDVFLFISGSPNNKTVFGSDVHISGNLNLVDNLSGSVASDINDLDAFITSVSSTVDGLDSSALSASITALSGATAADVNDLQNQIDNLDSTTLSGAVASDINDLNSDLTSLSSSVAADVNSLESDVATNAGNISTNTTAITELSGAVATDIINLEADVATNASDISLLSGSVSTDINNLNADVTSLSGSVAQDVNDIEQSVTDLSGAVSADVVDLQGQINAIDIDNIDRFFFSNTNEVIESTGSLQLTGSISSPTITAINDEITLVSSSLVSFSGSVASEINDLQSTAVTNTADIATAEGNITTLQSDLTSLSGSVAADINDLQSDVSTLSSSVATDVNNLQTDVNTNTGDINNLSGSVAQDIIDLNAAIGAGGLFQNPTAGEIVQTGSLSMSGSATFKSGISASIGNLPNGDPLFIASTGISINQASNGQITFTNTSLGDAGFFFSETDEVIESSGSLHLSGALLANSGLTGALNELPDGSPFMAAGENITLSTGSNGQITIDGGSAFFFSETADVVEQSGSLELSGTISATNITTIESDITQNASDITSLSSSVASDVNTLDGRITTVSSSIASDINDNNNSILANAGDITSLSSSVASDINALQADVSTNSSDITSLSGSVATDINDLQADVSTNSGDISTNTTNITNLSGSVASDINDLQTDFNNFQVLKTSQNVAGTVTTATTSSLPQVIGAFEYNPNNWQTSNGIFLKAPVSVGANTTGSLLLYNLTDSTYVDINASSPTTRLETTNPTTEVLTSKNLSGSTGITNGDATYEVRIYADGTASELVFNVFGVEITI